MNILIAPNSMKGSLDAAAFSDCLEAGFRSVSPVFAIRKVPVADGGDFTGRILCEALSANLFTETVADPLGRSVEAVYGIAGSTAIIEMASASGLRLLKHGERKPLEATSRGTGQLILAALERGCRRIILGAGGSATIDGGIGMLEALGFTFNDRYQNQLPGNCRSLGEVATILRPDSLPAVSEVIVLADVVNPLLGTDGAVAVYGPQKGATGRVAATLEAGLTNWIACLEKTSGKTLRDLPGMGAAGGLAAGLVAFLNGTVTPGAGFVFDILKMEEHLRWADWVFTGEGKADSQSLENKAPMALAVKASALGKPVTLIAGSYDPACTAAYDAAFSISNGPETLAGLMDLAPEKSTTLARQLARFMLKANPVNFTYHNLLTEAEERIHANDTGKALEILHSISSCDLAGYWYLCGLVNQKRQQWGEALNHFTKCLRIDPGHKRATVSLDMIREILSFRNPSLLNP